MLNTAILMGRLTADPEVRQTPNGISVCSFSIAVDRFANGERKADFINCVAWRNSAEFIARYFQKGSMIAVTGSIQTRNYEDKNGNKRTAFEVICDSVELCDSKNDAQGAETAQGGSFIPPAYQMPAQPKFEEIKTDDDLPF